MLKISQTLIVLGLVASFGASALALSEGKDTERSAESKALEQNLRQVLSNGGTPKDEQMRQLVRERANKLLAGTTAPIDGDLLASPVLDINGTNKQLEVAARAVSKDPAKTKFLKGVFSKLTGKVDFGHKMLAASLLSLMTMITPLQAAALDTPKEEQKIADLANVYDGEALKNDVRIITLATVECALHPEQDIHKSFDNATENYLVNGQKMSPDEAKQKVKELDNPENKDESCLI
jgi:hypothetical protein